MTYEPKYADDFVVAALAAAAQREREGKARTAREAEQRRMLREQPTSNRVEPRANVRRSPPARFVEDKTAVAAPAVAPASWGLSEQQARIYAALALQAWPDPVEFARFVLGTPRPTQAHMDRLRVGVSKLRRKLAPAGIVAHCTRGHGFPRLFRQGPT